MFLVCHTRVTQSLHSDSCYLLFLSVYKIVQITTHICVTREMEHVKGEVYMRHQANMIYNGYVNNNVMPKRNTCTKLHTLCFFHGDMIKAKLRWRPPVIRPLTRRQYVPQLLHNGKSIKSCIDSVIHVYAALALSTLMYMITHHI